MKEAVQIFFGIIIGSIILWWDVLTDKIKNSKIFQLLSILYYLLYFRWLMHTEKPKYEVGDIILKITNFYPLIGKIDRIFLGDEKCLYYKTEWLSPPKEYTINYPCKSLDTVTQKIQPDSNWYLLYGNRGK